MLRTLAIVLALAAPGALPAQPTTSIQSQSHGGPVAPMVDRLWNTLDLDALMPILREEAVSEASEMQQNLFQRGGTGGWTRQVASIHDPARLKRVFRDGLQAAWPRSNEALIEGALTFYRSDLGRRLIGLETTARRAMLDADAEDAAREAFAAAASREEPRVAQIWRLIDEADLIGPNVAGGMNAAVAFSEGFAEGGGFDMPMSDEQILRDAWDHEAELRSQTMGWMEAYLLLAYSPLSDAELDEYIAFASSDEGKALSALMFSGFDALFAQTSRDLGLAAAGQMRGREL